MTVETIDCCVWMQLRSLQWLMLGIGDIGNWMDSTTGAFNYTGLVENMEMKAGAFYSMHFL